MQCEEQIATMLTDFQILLVNAALQDDKFQELRVVEGEVSAVVQKEVPVAEPYLFIHYITPKLLLPSCSWEWRWSTHSLGSTLAA